MDTCSELHRYYDALTLGICLITREGERILFANRGMCALYNCATEEEFLGMTGGVFSGMTTRQGLSLARACGQRTDYFTVHYSFRTRDLHFREADAIVTLMEAEGIPCYCMQTVTTQMERSVDSSDHITGFPGAREFFQGALAMARGNAEKGTFASMCPACFNIANFRGFNRENGMEEGDRVLAGAAKALREIFPGGYFGHPNADTFYAILPREDLRARTDALCRSVNRMLGEGGYAMKAGLVIFDKPVSTETLRHSFDMARIACDSVKSDRLQNFAVFREEMQEQLELRQYVLGHFEEALRQGYLKVYYQPIVRTATGKVCALEALSRWEDPEKGILSPLVFVPTLERARRIGQLDAYMIEKVAQFQSERQKSGEALLPISLNLSRLDFDLIQPLAKLEEVCAKYRIPAGCICAEITETMVAENREEMGLVIRGFHEAGFEIWLDDFGAEYSSLNSLHRCPFDLIKLDMGFFQNFDDKSRAILTNLVSMAKDLGMHTLAEGVETKEQVDFLAGIGCERIQGYYYGRPEPYASLVARAAERGLVPENELERSIFDAAGLVNLVSQTPKALFFVKGKTLRLLAANAAFWPELAPKGELDLAEVNRILQDPAASRQNGRFLAGAGRVFRDGKDDMIAVLRGEYLRFHAEKIAGVEGFWAGSCTLINMRYDQEIGEAKQLDRIFRHLIPLYESICITDPGADTLRIFFAPYQETASFKTVPGAASAVRRFAQNHVDPADRDRFLSYYQTTLAETKVRENLFRLRGQDGVYRWCLYTAIPVHFQGRRCVLFCSRLAVMEREKDLVSVVPVFAASFGAGSLPSGGDETLQQEAALFRALAEDAGIPVCWKNPQQQYLGMNEAFCQLTGLADSAQAIGRTAAELGLYLDGEVPKKEEEKVLQGAAQAILSPRTFLARGRVHTSRFLEVPFYRGKQVGGLLGLALERPEEDGEAAGGAKLLDTVGILQAGMTLDDAFRRTGRGYCAVLLLLQNFESLCKTYGENFAGEAAGRIGSALLSRNLPRDAVAGRLATRAFLLLAGEKSAEGIVKAAIGVQDKIEALRGIGGTPCRLVIARTIGVGRETESFFSLIRLLSLRAEPLRSKERTALDEVWQLVGMRWELLNGIPDRAALVDPETKELVYLNRALLRDLDLRESFTPEGKTCYGVLRGRQEPCSDCTLRREPGERYYASECTWENADRDYLFRSFPVTYLGRQLCLFLATPAKEDESYGNLLLDSETWANEAITIGLEARDPDLGIRKCIARIAECLKSERFFIFEERRDGTAACTYEWTRAGLLPWKGELSSVLLSDLAPLYEIFRTNKVAVVEDYADFAAKNPSFFLPIPGIENFISGRLAISGEPLGFTLVLNSPDCRPAGYMLSTLTDFIAVMLRNRNSLRDANEQSLRDPMTGVCNRRGLERYLKERTDTGSVVFVSGDINGLKDRNDTKGHEAGDALIRTCADTLIKAADRDHVFRMGGDEFLLIREGMDEAGARELVRGIRYDLTAEGCGMALGYVIRTGAIDDMDAVLREADLAMYEDKGRSHRRRRTDPKD